MSPDKGSTIKTTLNKTYPSNESERRSVKRERRQLACGLLTTTNSKRGKDGDLSVYKRLINGFPGLIVLCVNMPIPTLLVERQSVMSNSAVVSYLP